MAPGYYSTTEVARKLGITRAALHLWVKKGQVKRPRVKVGRALAWSEAELRQLRAAQPRIRQNKGGRPSKKKGE